MNQALKKRIGKLKTDYRKKAKELGFTLKIARDEDIIYLLHESGDQQYYNQMTSFASVTVVEKLQRHAQHLFPSIRDESTAQKIAYEYWRDYATIMGAGLFVSGIAFGNAPSVTKENLPKFRLILRTIQENWEVIELKKGYQKKLFDVLEMFEQQILRQKQKDPTCHYKFTCRFPFQRIEFYYQGVQKEMIFEEKENKWSISFFDEKIEFETAAQLAEVFPGMIKNIENKQRLKNLTSPPKYHFNRLIESTIGSSHELKEKIYDILSGYYTPFQIEEGIAKLNNQLPVVLFEPENEIFYESSVRFFELLERIFVLDVYKSQLSDAIITTYPIERFHEAKAHFDQLVIRIVVKKNENKFNQIEQKAKEKTC